MFNQTVENITILFFAIIVLLILFSTLIVFVIYKFQQKQILNSNHIIELKTNHEKQMLLSKIEMQEQTFSNISRDIHDNVGQKLSLTKLYLNTLITQVPEANVESIKDTVKILTESIEDLRDLSRSMSTDLIIANGLVKGIVWEIECLNKPCLYDIKLSITGEQIFMNSDRELIVFRIVQEVLNNIIKHAKAQKIELKLSYNTTSLNLSIADDGIGLPKNLNVEKSNGLLNIHKRTELLQGQIKIGNNQPKGTIININIPLHEKAS
ncbi:MAG: sensor histidine kinase [Ferruginibacter sp.]